MVKVQAWSKTNMRTWGAVLPPRLELANACDACTGGRWLPRQPRPSSRVVQEERRALLSTHCTASSRTGLGQGAPPGRTWARPSRRRSCRPARRPRRRTTRASRGRPGRAGGGGAGTRGPGARCASARSRAAVQPPPPGPPPARALSQGSDPVHLQTLGIFGGPCAQPGLRPCA